MKTMHFDNFLDYHECDRAKQNDIIAVIQENGWIRADLSTTCKHPGTAVNRFFKNIGIPELRSWEDCVRESIQNGFRQDHDCWYSWGLEAYGDNDYYFFLNVKAN